MRMLNLTPAWPTMDLEEVLPGLCEQYGSRPSSHATRYVCDHVGIRRVKQRAASVGLWKGFIKFMKEVFLPQGYPDTVSSDYISYQMWDTLQAFCSSITGMLATLAILKGVGVGDSTATPLAAALTWMFKDGAGMVSRILFAWLQGVDLDCNAKRWRLVADVLNDFGLFLELLAPLFPSFFLIMVCTAAVSRAIVGSAGMATRAALVQHQARRNNMADVAAKDNSQETVVNLAGLLVNLWLTPLVADSHMRVWGLFIVFTLLHLLANYRAVSVVCMETLNKNRLHIVISDYLSTGRVPTPATVNAREPIILWPTRLLSYTLGAHVSAVVNSSVEYRTAVKRYRNGDKYILKFHPSQKTVLVALHADSSAADQLRAAISVEVLDYIFGTPSLSSNDVLAEHSDTISRLKSAGDDCAALTGYVDSEVCGSLLSSLIPALSQAGWCTSHHLLGAMEWRYTWQQL